MPPPPSGPSASSNNKAVLEDVVKAIDAVARPNGPPLSSSSPTVPVTAAASTSASAFSLTPPATVTPVSAKQPTGNNGSTTAAVSETNGVVRQSRFPGEAAAGDGAVEGSDGKTSSAGAGIVQPSGTRKDVLAAAAEVNGVGQDVGETTRLSEGVQAPLAVAVSRVVASTGEESAAVAAAAEPQAVGTVGTEQNSRGMEVVPVEQGAPPATMAEVRCCSRRCGESAWGVDVRHHFMVDWRSLPSMISSYVTLSAMLFNVFDRGPRVWVG